MKVYLSLLILLPALSGCWSQNELTDIAIVTALGIDIDENGNYIGTFQIIVPGNAAGGLQGGGTQQGAPVTSYSTTGKSIVELSRRAAGKVSRTLFYSHASLVVIGEEMAKNIGISKVLEALDRDIQFRKTSKVAIAYNSKASDILSITVPIEKNPSNKIIKMIETSEKKWGAHLSIDIRKIIAALTTAGKDPIIPGVEILGNEEKGKGIGNIESIAPKATLATEKSAIFKGDKLAGWIGENEAKGTLWAMDKIKETVVMVDWEGEQDAISFQVFRADTKVTPIIRDGVPVISMHIHTKGELEEVDVPVDLQNLKLRDEIERKVANEIKDLVLHAVKEAQLNNADIFGFGDKFYRSHPKKWSELESEWDERYFSDLEVKLKVEANIVRTGLRKNPFILDMKKKPE